MLKQHTRHDRKGNYDKNLLVHQKFNDNDNAIAITILPYQKSIDFIDQKRPPRKVK